MSVCSEEELATVLGVGNNPLGSQLYEMLCNVGGGAIRYLDTAVVLVVSVSALIIAVYIAIKASRVILTFVKKG